MEIEFRRTGATRYGIEARREHFPHLSAATAPGFHPEVSHDLLHFLAEAELGLRKGIFGQLASGGSSGFDVGLSLGAQKRELGRIRRRTKNLNKKLAAEGRGEMEWSERAVWIFLYEWLARSSQPERRRRARAMTDFVERIRHACSDDELEALTEPVIQRVCCLLDELSTRWRRLPVGEGVTLQWPFPEAPAKKGQRRLEARAPERPAV